MSEKKRLVQQEVNKSVGTTLWKPRSRIIIVEVFRFQWGCHCWVLVGSSSGWLLVDLGLYNCTPPLPANLLEGDEHGRLRGTWCGGGARVFW